MNCHTHPDAAATAICKFCGKGICTACQVDTGAGFACSPACAEEVQLANRLAKHAQKLYSIDNDNRRKLPTQVYGLLLFALAFAGFAIYAVWDGERFMGTFFGVFGGVFALGAFIAWWKFREHRINI